MAPVFKTIADIKNYNKINGYKFFDKDTMKWWQSLIMPNVYGNRFFVTSERPYWAQDERWYSVRCIMDDGSIQTIRSRMSTVKREALQAARDTAKSWRNVEVAENYDACRLEASGINPLRANDKQYLDDFYGVVPAEHHDDPDLDPNLLDDLSSAS